MIRVSIALLSIIFLIPAFAQEFESTVAQEDICKDKIMNLASNDLKRISPNALISACQRMPLADDFGIQMLSVVIGKPLVAALAAFSSLSGEAHGIEEDSALLTLASPLHDALEAFNWFLFAIMMFFIFLGAASQILSWQKGDFKVDFAKWFSRNGPTKLVSVFLSTPFIGWLTPIQFISLVVVVGFVYVAKFIVVYLFLASFLGESVSSIGEYLSDSMKASVRNGVLMYQCDINARAELITAVANNVDSALPLKSEIEKSPLYQCLTGNTGLERNLSLISKGGGVLRYQYKPASISQTESCIRENQSELKKYSEPEPASCGLVTFSLPDNINKGVSVENAMLLYASNEIESIQKDLAINITEQYCRENDLFGLVSYCLVVKKSGQKYNYEWMPTEDGLDGMLAEYRSPFSPSQLRQHKKEFIRDGLKLLSYVGSSSTVLVAHINDLIAPTKSEADMEQSVKDDNAALRSRLLSGYGDGVSVIGYSEKDVEFLVDSMKRGAWASGGLFFGKLTEGIEREKLTSTIASVYQVQSGESVRSWVILKVEELRELVSNEDVMPLDDINSRGALTSLILPRLGMYNGSYNCWYDQRACRTPALNPFTYLTDRGAQLMDEAMNTFVISSMVYKITDVMTTDKDKLKRGDSTGQGTKLMLAQAIADFNFIYLLMGVVLTFIIPAMPLFKIMVMMVNWIYDLLRELMGLQITFCMSGLGEQGKNLLGQDIREALGRVLGLGLYFLFMMLGVVCMFLIFSFLFSMNIFVIGALSYMIDWTGVGGGMQPMVISVIFDVLVVMILFYEIKKCTPYIEKFPMMLAEQFGIRITSSSGVVQQAMQKMQTIMVTDVSRFLDSTLRN